MATTVIRVRNADWTDPDTVYIGRAFNRGRYHLPHSPWANPFRIGDKHPIWDFRLKRDDVVSAYSVWVKWSDDARAAWIRAHVHELKGKKLACWCAPYQCHGDFLKSLADASDAGGVA